MNITTLGSDVNIDLSETRLVDYSEIVSGHEMRTTNGKSQMFIYEKGAYKAHEEYKVTIVLIRFPHEIPKFIIEKKSFFSN